MAHTEGGVIVLDVKETNGEFDVHGHGRIADSAPVFAGQNPLTGTCRQQNDGDYLCSREEVVRMLAYQADQPADCEILTGFGLDDLDHPCIRGSRPTTRASRKALWLANRSCIRPW